VSHHYDLGAALAGNSFATALGLSLTGASGDVNITVDRHAHLSFGVHLDQPLSDNSFFVVLGDLSGHVSASLSNLAFGATLGVGGGGTQTFTGLTDGSFN